MDLYVNCIFIFAETKNENSFVKYRAIIIPINSIQERSDQL